MITWRTRGWNGDVRGTAGKVMSIIPEGMGEHMRTQLETTNKMYSGTISLGIANYSNEEKTQRPSKGDYFVKGQAQTKVLV